VNLTQKYQIGDHLCGDDHGASSSCSLGAARRPRLSPTTLRAGWRPAQARGGPTSRSTSTGATRSGPACWAECFSRLAYFGTDQSQVQRYLTGASLRESRLGLMFNGVCKIPMQFFILLLGVLIFVFYQFERPPVFFNQVAWKQQAEHGAGERLRALETDYAAAHARGTAAPPCLARRPARGRPAGRGSRACGGAGRTCARRGGPRGDADRVARRRFPDPDERRRLRVHHLHPRPSAPWQSSACW